MELCLGTVQFGMDYGINGKKKPTIKECVNCMDYAVCHGIKSIDTAAAYGNAEEVVGVFLKRKTVSREKLWISSKLMPNILDNVSPNRYKETIRNELTKSLTKLGTEYLDAYYFHSSRYSLNDEMLDSLYELQLEGLVRKIGVSIYEIDEAFACIESPKVSIMQAPYSVFDHRMKNNNIFSIAKTKGMEVDTRSAFLQGLILKNREMVPTSMKNTKDLLARFSVICNKYQIDPVVLALSYVKREKEISRLVFGIHSIEQLQQDIMAFCVDVPYEILNEIDKEFQGVSRKVIIPSLWGDK